MSEREQVLALLDGVPDYKIGYVLAYIQGLTADENEDDEFCQSMCLERETGETFIRNNGRVSAYGYYWH